MIARLSAIPGYVSAFDAAFGKGDITTLKIEQALGDVRAFDRIGRRAVRPLDRGDQNAIDASAKRGFALFNGKAQLRGLSQRLGFYRRHRFTISASPRMTISVAAGCFRNR